MIQGIAHTTNLPVEALDERYFKRVFSAHYRFAGQRFALRNKAHATGKLAQELGCGGRIGAYNIFFIVAVAGTQNLIYNVAIVGQKDEAFRIFIEAANGEDALWMTDGSYNIGFIGRIGGRGYALRFMVGNETVLPVFCSGSPSTSTLSPGYTRLPVAAVSLLMVTRLVSMYLSASRREQKPDAEINLLSEMEPSSCTTLGAFFLRCMAQRSYRKGLLRGSKRMARILRALRLWNHSNGSGFL